MSTKTQFSHFVKTVEKLRDPKKGCPWDIKQTHETLIRFLIEECFEAVDSIEREDYPSLEEELGDVLLQVVLHSVIAQEANLFSIDDVISRINEKMIRRHPHVFSDIKVQSIEEVKKNWEEIKKDENKATSQYSFSNKDLQNTATICADKIGKKTSRLNFDWDTPSEVMEKVKEEITELEREMKDNPSRQKIQEEFGDLLFSVIQLGRHLNLDSEYSLRKANMKFIKRFTAMEDLAKKQNKALVDISKEEKEQLWGKVKAYDKN